MKAHNKLTIAASLVLVLGAVGIAMAIDYGVYTPIEDVDITYPATFQIVFAGCDYTVTCTTSTDEDCHQEGDEIIIDDDPVTHTWSGPGTFDPTTGTSVTWTAPTTPGRITIYVTADDSPLADDNPKRDGVSVIVSDIIYVDGDATAGNDDGTTWANAFLKLQDALDAAGSDCLQIWVAEGTYYPDEGESVTQNDRTETFQLIDGVEIYGGFDPTVGDDEWAERDWVNNVTTLSGDIGTQGVFYYNDNSYHVVKGADDAVIDGFTITKGYANGSDDKRYGAGMFNYYTSPTVENCSFTWNLCYRAYSYCGGGGMYNGWSNAIITGCTFCNNMVGSRFPYWPEDPTNIGNGGAMLNAGSSAPTITNCVLSANYANTNGGAIDDAVCDPTIKNCVFVMNDAASYGGGIMNNSGSDPTVTNSTFTANSAGSGGGILNWMDSDPVLTNCIFWGNTATYNGGEICNWHDEADPNFSYCDIEGGINGTKCAGYDSIDGGGNINADPNFVDDTDPDGDDDKWMTADDGLVIDDTRAIDAANGNVDPTTDILGNSRYDDSSWSNIGIGSPAYVDMGAYEYQGP